MDKAIVESVVPENPPSGSFDSDDENTMLNEQLIIVMRKNGKDETANIDKIKQLLFNGADINSKGGNGETSLHIAVREKQANVVKFLVGNCAKIDIVDDNGKTPLDIAAETHLVDILQSSTSCGTKTSKLEEFIEIFVSEFEAKLLAYHLATKGLVKKAGKMSDTFSEPLGIILQGIATGNVAFQVTASIVEASADCKGAGGVTALKLLGDWLGDKYHTKKVKKVAILTSEFVNNRANLRYKLVENGFDIFQSFEMQFMKVAEQKYSLHKFAKDAVNRAINYFGKKRDLSIAESVILGKSKIENVWGVPIASRKLRSPGFKISFEYESKKVTWCSASLYDKAGIVIDSVDPRLYFKKIDGTSRTEKYFHRRPLAAEVWDTVKETYVEDYAVDESNYQFITNSKNIQEESKIIFEKINSRQSIIEIDLTKLVTRFYNEIVCELKSLGYELTALEEQMKLKSLNKPKYTTMIDGDELEDDTSLESSFHVHELLEDITILQSNLTELDIEVLLKEFYSAH